MNKLGKCVIGLVLVVISGCAGTPALVPIAEEQQPTVRDISLMVERTLTQFVAPMFAKEDAAKKPVIYVGEVSSAVDFTNIDVGVVRAQIEKRLGRMDKVIVSTDKEKPYDFELSASFALNAKPVNVTYDYRELVFNLDVLNVSNGKHSVMSEILRLNRGTGAWE